jgi:hypothetical protein
MAGGAHCHEPAGRQLGIEVLALLHVWLVDEQYCGPAVAQHAHMFARRQAPVERNQYGAESCAGKQERQQLRVILPEISDAIPGLDAELGSQQLGAGLDRIVELRISDVLALKTKRDLAGRCPRPFFDPVCNVHLLTFARMRR